MSSEFAERTVNLGCRPGLSPSSIPSLDSHILQQSNFTPAATKQTLWFPVRNGGGF
jgi:hypothetical protein